MPKPEYDKIMRVLKRDFTAPAASERRTPWRVVLFTMLTARSRDEQVEPPFRELMRAYPTPAALAEAKVGDVERILRSIGFYRTKARLAIGLAKAVVRDHGGKVPADMDALAALPGVGRKTASCTLVYAFGVPAVAVDTHVHRIVNRLGWVKEPTPPRTERALLATLPKKHWMDVNRVMVQFGRAVCTPGRPRCWTCPVAKWCAFPAKTRPPKER